MPFDPPLSLFTFASFLPMYSSTEDLTSCCSPNPLLLSHGDYSLSTRVLQVLMRHIVRGELGVM